MRAQIWNWRVGRFHSLAATRLAALKLRAEAGKSATDILLEECGAYEAPLQKHEAYFAAEWWALITRRVR
jgi:hypothetical protein